MKEIIFREIEVRIPEKGKRLVPYAELIRCEDCKKFEDPEACPMYDMERPDDWYCANGEREENDG